MNAQKFNKSNKESTQMQLKQINLVFTKKQKSSEKIYRNENYKKLTA